MKELNREQILHHLKQNTIGRNHQLSVLIKLLNATQENTVLAIDGSWGSGKTVFIKQLCMLADSSIEDYGRNSLDDVAIENLRNNQKVFYFNAWENDYIGDALGAILLKLIAVDDESLNAATIKRAATMINLSAGIKNVSHDFIDFSANTSKERLVKNVQEIVNRHDAINEFLDKLKGDSQRIVFVVDELDRCKPSFAIDLLELMKHYFVRDDVTFILTTNIKELSHTVQKYYGYNFDSSSYLNKFIDFSFTLASVDIENYARSALSWAPNGYVVHEVAHDAIRYFNFSMREINSYHSALRLIDNFLRRDRNWEDLAWSVQLIFTPIALALKVRNDPRYAAFASGTGTDLLTEFLPSSDSALHYATSKVENRANLQKEDIQKQAIEVLVKHYADLFKPDGRRANESLQNFNDAISLMSNYTTISIPEEK